MKGKEVMSKKVLICDDASFMRKMLGETLEKLGCTVVGEATDGIDVVNKYKELNPDVVFMDITMPNKDGITALKDIMSIDSDAKVIMCSAMGQQCMIVDSIKAGAVDFVVKPFVTKKIAEAIAKV